MMHRIRYASLLALLIVLVGELCVPSSAQAECTAATIGNTYGLHLNGLRAPAADHALKISAFVPSAGVGEVSFTATSDSGGTLSGSESLSFGGQQLQLTFTGTYSVNSPRCTGSITTTFEGGGSATLDLVIVKRGKEIEFLQTDAGAVTRGVMKKE